MPKVSVDLTLGKEKARNFPQVSVYTKQASYSSVIHVPRLANKTCSDIELLLIQNEIFVYNGKTQFELQIMQTNFQELYFNKT